MKMDVGEFIEFVLNAREMEERDRLHKQWTAMLPLMSIQYLEYMTFEDYVDRCTGANIDMRPTNEIIADILDAHEKVKSKKEGE